MRTLAILDIEYYKGELFVAGISNEEFASTLRRMPYPFTGSHTSSHIKMWHIAHDQYETRAPIRTMVAKNIGGVDYLVASYTCSPIVLIPLKDLQDGASVTGRRRSPRRPPGPRRRPGVAVETLPLFLLHPH